MEPSDPQFKEAKVAEAEKKFPVFLSKLKGWMTDPDGEDHCPSCWEQYLAQFEGKYKEAVLEDSHSTAEPGIAKTRKAGDGWYVLCELCGQDVFVPYREEKNDYNVQ